MTSSLTFSPPVSSIKSSMLCITLGIFALIVTPLAQAKPLRVGISGSEPFLSNQNEKPEGISVDVWRDLALKQGLDYEWVPLSSIDASVKAVADGQIDLAIGPISITPERLAIPTIEFTQPYFFAKVGVLLHQDPPGPWRRFSPFFRLAALSSLAVLLISLFVVGNLIWLAEHRHNPQQFPPNYKRGVATGMWFALVTMTTVGYGDRTPITLCGRFISSIWMLVTLLAVSSITAGLASAFTVSLARTPLSQILDPKDLASRPVAVVSGTTSEQWGRIVGASLSAQPDLRSAIKLLESKEVDAVIYDTPVLRYFLRQNSELPLRMAAFDLGQETYGFVIPRNSFLERPLDVGLLEMQHTGRIRSIQEMWLQTDPEGSSPGDR